jgi:hypothetical protein
MFSIMLKKKDSPRTKQLHKELFEQQKRIHRAYKEMENAEHQFYNASPSFTDVAIHRWDMAQKRVNFELQAYKALEEELKKG